MDHLISSISESGVLTLTFNREKKLNAINSAMYSFLSEQLLMATTNETIKCVVLRGSESCFTAGNDLHDFLSFTSPEEMPSIKFIHTLAQFNKPLLAAVAGPAIGIGSTLLLHCDYVVAADNAIFKMPFSQLGLCPEAASSLLLPNLVGHKKAFELLVLGQKFSAVQALEFGLINASCQPNRLFETIDSITRELVSLPIESVMLSKQLLKQNTNTNLTNVIDNELTILCRLLQSSETKEIIDGFFNKN